VRYEGEPIRIVVRPYDTTSGSQGPGFSIEGAQWLAETFFRRDPSSVGQRSYDAWIATTQAEPDRLNAIEDGDVTAVNRTMAARTSHAKWGKVIEEGDWSALAELDLTWDLFDLDDSAWAANNVAGRLQDTFAAIRRPGLGVAVITKVLHIKRPRLIPVVDSLVVEQVGTRIGKDVSTWVDTIEAVRDVGRRNYTQLQLVNAHLADRGITGRTLVRVLDALLWTSHSRSNLFGSLTGWERVLRPSDSLRGLPTGLDEAGAE